MNAELFASEALRDVEAELHSARRALVVAPWEFRLMLGQAVFSRGQIEWLFIGEEYSQPVGDCCGFMPKRSVTPEEQLEPQLNTPHREALQRTLGESALEGGSSDESRSPPGLTPPMPPWQWICEQGSERIAVQEGRQFSELLSKFKQLELGAERFDVLIYILCAKNLTHLQMASVAYRLLEEGGRLLVFDFSVMEIVDYQALASSQRDCLVVSALKSTVPRCGFSLDGVFDHYPRNDSDFSPGGDSSVSRSVDLPAFRGFRFLRKETRWRVSDARLVDKHHLFHLFSHAFERPVSPALWDWKHENTRAYGVVAWHEGEVVAHYGCLSRDILFLGVPARALQVCDVMVASRERGALTRKGPFFLTAATAAEQFLQDHAVGFGFPTPRALAAAERMGLYAKVDHIVSLTWSAGVRRPLLRSRVRLLVLPQDRATLESLWQGMAADFQDRVIGVRDCSYLEQRYLRHPVGKYLALLVSDRFHRRPLGAIVLGAVPEDGVLELLDWIGPRSAFPTLLAQARRVCNRLGARRLKCWSTEGDAVWMRGEDGEMAKIDVSIPASTWVVGPGVEMQQQRWWLMAGDTDFR